MDLSICRNKTSVLRVFSVYLSKVSFTDEKPDSSPSWYTVTLTGVTLAGVPHRCPSWYSHSWSRSCLVRRSTWAKGRFGKFSDKGRCWVVALESFLRQIFFTSCATWRANAKQVGIGWRSWCWIWMVRVLSYMSPPIFELAAAGLHQQKPKEAEGSLLRPFSPSVAGSGFSPSG